MKRNALLILMTAFLLGACGQDDDQAMPDEEPMSEESGTMESDDTEMDTETSAADDERTTEESGFQADADNDGTLDYEIKVIDHSEDL